MLERMIVAKRLKCWKKFDYLAMDEQKGERHISFLNMPIGLPYEWWILVAVQQSASLMDNCGRPSTEPYGNTRRKCFEMSVGQDDTPIIDLKHRAHVS
jgi:hypothetical protein